MQVGSVARKEYIHTFLQTNFFLGFFSFPVKMMRRNPLFVHSNWTCHSFVIRISQAKYYSLYLPIYELSSSCCNIIIFFLLKSFLTSSSFFCKVERVIVVVVNIIIFSLFWRKIDPIYCTICVMELFEKKNVTILTKVCSIGVFVFWH